MGEYERAGVVRVRVRLLVILHDLIVVMLPL
jgi:hypothetical protein